MGQSLLSVRSLGVSRGGRALVARLDLDVGAGEGVAVAGPSGSGKSSLLRVLAGLDAAGEGEVLLAGRPPHEVGWTRFRRAVQLVPAVPALSGRAVADALARAFSFAASATRFDVDAARTLLERTLLDPEVLLQDPDTLSTGQRLRLGLVRALLVRPDVLLLDEPTAALDRRATRAVEDLLLEELRRGVALVIVTHDDAQAERLGARRLHVGEEVRVG